MNRKSIIIKVVIITLIFSLLYMRLQVKDMKNKELDLFYRNLNVYDEMFNYKNELEYRDIAREVNYLTLINSEINNCGRIYISADSIKKMDSKQYILNFISSIQLYTWALQEEYFNDKTKLVDFDKVCNDIMEVALIIKDFNPGESFSGLHDRITRSNGYENNGILKTYSLLLKGQTLKVQDIEIPYK
jgi:hypothetical protein